MKEELLVSIITIVYNGHADLERTLHGVFNQSYSNIEYIVIDGGSSDGTLDIIKKHENKLSYWISETDEGISDAFNKGIRQSTGDLIGLINCGDYYQADAIQNMVNAYAAAGISTQEYAVLHGDIRMFNVAGNSRVYPPFSIDTFTYQMPIWHPTVFASRKVYEDIQYNKGYKVAMDYELFSRLYIKKCRFIYVNSLITNMNIEGLSNSNAIAGFREVMKASRQNLNVNETASYLYFLYRAILHKLISLKKRKCLVLYFT